jgi:hypothetical protein
VLSRYAAISPVPTSTDRSCDEWFDEANHLSIPQCQQHALTQYKDWNPNPASNNQVAALGSGWGAVNSDAVIQPPLSQKCFANLGLGWVFAVCLNSLRTSSPRLHFMESSAYLGNGIGSWAQQL